MRAMEESQPPSSTWRRLGITAAVLLLLVGTGLLAYRAIRRPLPVVVMNDDARRFQRTGLDPRYQPMVNVLAKAREDYQALVPEYERQRVVKLAPELARQMKQLAEDVDIACRWMERSVDSPHRLPTRALAQFRRASRIIRANSTGAIESLDYDTDETMRRLEQGFANLRVWVQENYR